MFPVSAVPLRHGRILVHVFDNLAPANAGVVSAERNLPLLRSIGDDAHFRTAEVIVEEVLKPHSGNEQEIPGVLFAALLGVFEGSIGTRISVFLHMVWRQTPRFIELPPEINERQAGRSFVWAIVLQERKAHH